MRSSFLCLFLGAIMLSSMYGEYSSGPAWSSSISGSLSVTFYPKFSGGSSGSWQPTIITPDGIRHPGPEVNFDSLDPVTLRLEGSWLTVGSYGIEVKSNISGTGALDFLSFVSVNNSGDVVSYRNISPLQQGEKLILSYHLSISPEAMNRSSSNE